MSSIGGSQQLRMYRIARRDGADRETACEQSGISLGEAKLIDASDTKEPPGPECFVLLGHNQGPAMTDHIAADQLRLLIERIERLEEEKKWLANDIRDVYSEAKGQGYDTKIMRLVIRDRAMDKNARDERDALLDTYRAALGMLSDTPLGMAALARAGD